MIEVAATPLPPKSEAESEAAESQRCSLGPPSDRVEGDEVEEEESE